MSHQRAPAIPKAAPRSKGADAPRATYANVALPSSVKAAVGEPGQALDSMVRRDMEDRFAWDFSSVRIHTGGTAEMSADDVGAQAYTLGPHIVFSRGRYSLAGDGLSLLAHELAHVVQQHGARQFAVDGAPAGAEAEADMAASRVAGGLPAPTLHSLPFLHLARKPATPDEELLAMLSAKPRSSDPAVLAEWKTRLLEFAKGVEPARAKGLARRLDEKSTDALGRYFRAQVPEAGFRLEMVKQLSQHADVAEPASANVARARGASKGKGPPDPALEQVRKGAFLEVFKSLNGMWIKAMLERLAGFENTDLQLLMEHLSAADPLGEESKWRLAAAANAAFMQRNGASVAQLAALDELMERAKLPDDQRSAIHAIVPKPPGGAATRVSAAFDVIAPFGAPESAGGKMVEKLATANAFLILRDLPPKELLVTLIAVDKAHLRALMMNSRQAEKYGELKVEELRQAMYVAWLTRFPGERAKFDVGETENPILKMSSGAKIGEAMSRSQKFLSAEAWARLKELLTPEAIATMTAFATAYVVSQTTPVGWVADVIVGGMIVATVLMVGNEVIDIVKLLIQFTTKASNARSDEELDQAGELFARAVTKGGVDIIMAIIFHKAGKSLNLKPPRPRSPGLFSVLRMQGGKIVAPLDNAQVFPQLVTEGGGVPIRFQDLPPNIFMSEAAEGGARAPSTSGGGKGPTPVEAGGPEAPAKAPADLPGKKLAAAEGAAKKRPRLPRKAAEAEAGPSATEDTPAQQERSGADATTGGDAAAAARETAKVRLDKQLADKRSRIEQIYSEIAEAEQEGRQRLSDADRAKVNQKKAELAREANTELEVEEKLRKERAALEVSPLERARAYSYSASAAREVLARAHGLDEMSGRPAKSSSIDHVVPVDEIVRMEGWDDLPLGEQQEVLSNVDNLRLMEQSLNSSKGARRWVNWEQGRRIYGEDVWQRMVDLEGKLRRALQADIQARRARRHR